MRFAFIVSSISIRTGISVALIEILVGLVAGNVAQAVENGADQSCIDLMDTGFWTETA